MNQSLAQNEVSPHYDVQLQIKYSGKQRMHERRKRTILQTGFSIKDCSFDRSHQELYEL